MSSRGFLTDALEAELALERGYFDQSHLIHDFVVFSGLTPTVYLEHQERFREHRVHLKRNHLPLAASVTCLQYECLPRGEPG
jgi:hypothetical protein